MEKNHCMYIKIEKYKTYMQFNQKTIVNYTSNCYLRHLTHLLFAMVYFVFRYRSSRNNMPRVYVRNLPDNELFSGVPYDEVEEIKDLGISAMIRAMNIQITIKPKCPDFNWNLYFNRSDFESDDEDIDEDGDEDNELYGFYTIHYEYDSHWNCWCKDRPEDVCGCGCDSDHDGW